MRDRFLQFTLNIWEKNTDHADAAFGCSNASLSLTNVRELLPQPLWRCPDRLPSLRFRGFSNPFLKIGVRGGDSAAGRELARAMSKPLACDGRPRWSYPASLCVNILKKSPACIRRQKRALPAFVPCRPAGLWGFSKAGISWFR